MNVDDAARLVVLPASEHRADQEEFDEFYLRFTPRLVGFLMWQGAPARLAADLAQEAMIKAYQRWSQIRSPEAWLRRVASRDLVRYVSRVPEDPMDELPESPGPLIRSTDELAEMESRQELLDLLGSLPPRQRQVLAWSVDGYSPTEIAEELGINPATIRANLMKARRAVAGRLRNREDS
ncbi:RNA polymerase sigma factor [Kitasatospora purpeofusca]|uniref:RNA polymerase sigma factor n=1 Tax=Kitasatospora purpeofusca TaxID=67352 RepID=UPI0036D3DC37